MPAPGAPWHCQTPPVPQAEVIPPLGAQDSPVAEQGPGVPFPCVLRWGVKEQCEAGLGLSKGIPSPVWARRWRRER